MRYGDRGDDVRAVQRALMAREPAALPRWGADGHLGAETWAALRRLADALRVDPLDARPTRDSRVYPELLAALLGPTDEPECLATCEPTTQDDVRVYDLREDRIATRPKVRLDARGRPVVRDMSQVIGVVLHQTAVPFSVGAAQLRAADGDRALALARRGLGVACHAIAFREHPALHPPLAVLTAPLAWWVNHGNGANGASLGLEVDGAYAGVDGDPRTVWHSGGETPHAESTLAAARVALRLLVEHGRAAGAPLRYVWAHRQSSATRRSDPGEWLWRALVPYAATLGLEPQPTRVWGDGRPIPREWGGVGPY